MSVRTYLTVVFLFVFLLLAAGLTACNAETEGAPIISTFPNPPTVTEEESADPMKPAPATEAPASELSAGSPALFTSLLPGDLFDADVELPAIFIAGDAAEAEAFTGWMQAFDPTMAETVTGADFENKLVVALFAGQVGSSGYSITVQAVSVSDEEVKVVVTLGEPDPNNMVQAVISYPFEVIQVSRETLTDGPARWLLMDEAGVLLAEATYP